MIVHQIKSLW